MNRTKERFESLLNKYLDKSCSLEELKALFSYIDMPEFQGRLQTIMDEQYEKLAPGATVGTVDWDEMFAAILNKSGNSRTRSLWSRILPVAVAIFVILSVGILIWINQGQSKNERISVTAKAKKDIPPGGNRAVLKLANGTEIVLDGHQTGVLANEGVTKISMLKDGMLQYDAGEPAPVGTPGVTESRMNTLTTPRGGQYLLVLPDGSSVWLNAESTITYPSVFAGTERKVILTGEAYFEVAHDKKHPFKVMAGAAEVNVLGTHFNIMSYAEEGQIQVSLAEGSVRVNLKNDSQILKPGQQAFIEAGSNYINLTRVDIDEVTTWKNGLFQFDNTPIDQVMRQIKRWYNVDIVYKGIKPELYITGMISRKNNVSKILELIEKTGGVNFEIGDQQIIVKSNRRR